MAIIADLFVASLGHGPRFSKDPKLVDERQPSPFSSAGAGEVWLNLLVFIGDGLHDLHLATRLVG